jgi:hypothetical protein
VRRHPDLAPLPSLRNSSRPSQDPARSVSNALSASSEWLVVRSRVRQRMSGSTSFNELSHPIGSAIDTFPTTDRWIQSGRSPLTRSPRTSSGSPLRVDRSLSPTPCAASYRHSTASVKKFVTVRPRKPGWDLSQRLLVPLLQYLWQRNLEDSELLRGTLPPACGVLPCSDRPKRILRMTHNRNPPLSFGSAGDFLFGHTLASA